MKSEHYTIFISLLWHKYFFELVWMITKDEWLTAAMSCELRLPDEVTGYATFFTNSGHYCVPVIILWGIASNSVSKACVTNIGPTWRHMNFSSIVFMRLWLQFVFDKTTRSDISSASKVYSVTFYSWWDQYVSSLLGMGDGFVLPLFISPLC